LRTLFAFVRAAKYESSYRSADKDAATALVLLNEDNIGIRSWDLRNQTGLVIGRRHDEADVDVDLTGTEYFSLISDCHAVLNYTDKGWLLSDAGSTNGTALARAGSGQKLLLAPGEPVPIRPGDTIYIADETALKVQ
jgi:pSer/pThr/pTyr-binding forkhead associated (FHA) protein